MTLDEMIEILEDMRNEHGGECEVRLMTQPSWPFEWHIDGIVSSEQIREYREYEEMEDGEPCDPEDLEEDEDEKMPIIYLTEGRQIGYGTKDAWNV